MIKIETLSKSFEKKVLDNISLTIDDNEIVTILGKSGSGKTTLLKCIAEFIPYTGKIYTNDKIGYMFQDDMLLPFLNIYDNISISGKIKNVDQKDKILEYSKVCDIEDILYKFPNEISGGQKQRVAFLRAFLISQKILLLDEPFSKLDDFTRYSIYDWFIKMYQKFKFSTVLITHNIEEAILLSKKIYILEEGKITKEIKVDLSYPRDITSSEFNDIKRKVREYIFR